MQRFTFGQIRVVAFFALAVSVWIASDALAQNSSKQQPVSKSGPKRGYTISKETTYFTGPLKPDGTIDFVAAINEHFAKGVTDENNAARVVVPLLDPDFAGFTNSDRRERVLQSLGLDPAQYADVQTFKDVGTYLHRSPKEIEQFNKGYLAAIERPWSDDEFPKLKQWLADNDVVLAQISAAVRKDRYFVPFVIEGESDSLVSILLEHVQAARGLARAYAIRANNHLGHQRLKEAWQDILTIKDLGRLVGQGQTLVEGLVGVAITGIACQSATQFIAAADPKEVDWATLQESWQPRPIANISEALGVTERAMFIQTSCKIWDKPNEGILDYPQESTIRDEFAGAVPNKIFVKTLRDMLKSGEVKLDEALRYANEMYDRAIAISEMPDAEARKIAFEDLDKQLVYRPSDDQSPVLQVFFAKPEEPAEQFAKALLGIVFPSAHTINRAEWRTEASQNVVELALAARVLQSQTGNLPQSLRELEPLVDESTMIQPATGAQIALQSTDKGLLIYHWSSNQVDNGGNIDGTPPTDWGIRIEK